MADLLRPFGQSISSSSDADTAGKPAFHRGSHEQRREKSERDRDVDMLDASAIFCRKRRDSFASIDNLLKPFSAESDRSNDSNAGYCFDWLCAKGCKLSWQENVSRDRNSLCSNAKIFRTEL